MSTRISEMLRRLAATWGRSAPGGAGAASGAESPGAADVEAMLQSDHVPLPPLAARMRGRERLLSMAATPAVRTERRNFMTVFGFKLIPQVAGALAALVLVVGMAGAAAVTPLPGPQDAVTAAFDDDEVEDDGDGAVLEACEDDDELDDVDDVDDIEDDADDDIGDEDDDCDEVEDVEETPVVDDAPIVILPTATPDTGGQPILEIDDDDVDDDLDEPEDIEDEDDDLDDVDDDLDEDEADDDFDDVDEDEFDDDASEIEDDVDDDDDGEGEDEDDGDDDEHGDDDDDEGGDDDEDDGEEDDD